MAESRYPRPREVCEEVERVLQEITRTYFTRARFYTISETLGGEGIIGLAQQVGGLTDYCKPPIYRPLKGQILKRLQKYRQLGLGQIQGLPYQYFVEAEQRHDNEWKE